MTRGGWVGACVVAAGDILRKVHVLAQVGGEQRHAPPAREAVTRAFYADLRKRADELGGAKKYRVDAPRGFLNVHSEPDDPWRLDNVVEQLDHGTVVTAVEERDGWVRHDMGGWSIREHGGHAFLVPLDDDDVR